ncbi:hypothetical protein H0H92_004901 [Tricholoma furcatifolium]|nr:hypothetical protein H0H92_004901 [Tricholoma furcatifolium]
MSKGKKRAIDYGESRETSSSLSPAPVASSSKIKKPKRAETKTCPVCDEVVPIRLLGTHAELESQRLQAIFDQVGSTEPLFVEPDDGPGPSLRSARLSLRDKVRNSGPVDVLQHAGKAIQTIKRRRKQRHAQFREMGREEEKRREIMSWGNEIVCPVCMVTVRGDPDVLDAHVDACLANENRRLEEERQRTLEQGAVEELWQTPSNVDGAAGHVGDVRGLGFHTRNQNDQDIEDEIDVDGDEGFGDAQFTEGDVLPIYTAPAEVDQDEEVEIEEDGEGTAQPAQKSLRDLVAEGKVVRNGSGSESKETRVKTGEIMGLGDMAKMDQDISAARKLGDKASLIVALENKVKQLVRLLCFQCYSQTEELQGNSTHFALVITFVSNMP